MYSNFISREIFLHVWITTVTSKLFPIINELYFKTIITPGETKWYCCNVKVSLSHAISPQLYVMFSSAMQEIMKVLINGICKILGNCGY